MSVLTSLIKTLTKKHLAKAASKTKKDKRKGASSRRDPRKADEQEKNQRRAGYPSEAIGTPKETSTMKTHPESSDVELLDRYKARVRASTERGRKASSNLRETTDRRNPKDRRK